MKRLRLLRIVVPAVLAAFLVVVVLALRDRPSGPTPPLDADGGPVAARLEGFTITDIVGERRRLAVSARVGSWDDDGGFQAEGIDRIEVDREAGTPLIVSAAKGRGTGTQGRRVIRLEGGVEVRDDENGLLVSIPTLELDQGAGLARSLGEVEIASPTFSGKARSAVYPLDGRPTELSAVEFREGEGGLLRARRATLPRGGRSIDLEGEVELSRGPDVVRAERIRVDRDAAGQLSGAAAVGAVRGASERPGSPALSFHSSSAEFVWTDGLVSGIALQGEALVEQGGRTLQGDAIDASRVPSGWEVSATGGVVLAGALEGGVQRLQAAALEATLDTRGALRKGKATGGVRFDGRDAAGEGDAAEIVRAGGGERITLRSGSGRRARLALGRTRVTAETILTSGRGTRLEAEGRVEATLLADPSRRGAAGSTALFEGSQAIHFVAARLEAEESGNVLRFRQNVRGWQSDRNLSADEVDVDKRADALDARGRVSTRLPRPRSSTAGTAGYLQIAADVLRYRGSDGLATYSGGVRARLDEGWIDCGRLEVAIASAGGGVEEVRAFETVRFEFKAPPGSASAVPEPVTGNADRLLYAPEAGWVRLFGDRAPAEVRRGGPDGGTTAGRVLRYALETGRIEVESGSSGRNDPSRGTP